MSYEKKERKDGSRPYRGKRDDKGGRKPFKGKEDKRSDRPKKSFDKSSDHVDRPKRDSKRLSERGRSGHFDKKERNDRGRPYERIQDRPRVEHPREEEPRKMLLPQDASRLLYRGIDCQVNGNNNVAMIMFLHGSVMMSEGCENNARRILRESGKENFRTMRSDIAFNCSTEALIEYDYLCYTLDKGYDRTFFDKIYDEGNTHAIYRRICLEEVEGDDPIIDEFASRYDGDEKKVMKGLDILKRKKDSTIAEKHLTRIEDSIKLKQSINVLFTRAMNGDARAVSELKHHAKTVPEAAFYSEFLAARAEGNEVEWLRSKYPQYSDLIIARQGEFKIQDTPFGMYLKAKNLEMKKEESMSVMMNAAKAGSQEAIEELSKKLFRNDVRKCLASIYLKENDLDKLISVYEAGLDDMYYLDQYCMGDQQRVIEVGRALGKQSISKEIDWLKDHYVKGMEFCKDELIQKASVEEYRGKRLVYALHDIGADMEAAELYFSMEGNPEMPSVKWLKKVCSDEEVKEYVRSHYEAKGDTSTFDSIFADDGYERRPKKNSGFGGRSRGGPKRRY